MAGPREIAVSAVNAVLTGDVYSDTILDVLFSKEETPAKNLTKYLTKKDKALTTEITYGVLRNLGRIDFILSHFSKRPLKAIDDKVLNILRVALYQIVFLDKVPSYAAVNEAVELAAIFGKRSAGSFINGVLRSALRSLDTVKYPSEKKDPASFLSTFYSLPRWLAHFFIDTFGYEKAAIIAESYVQRPSITIRTNIMRRSREELLKILIERGFDASPTLYSPHGIMVEGGGALSKDEFFLNGDFTIQDEVSQIIPLILDPKPKMKVLDLCAAPGIKGSFISELMGDTGVVVSVDKIGGRAKMIVENVKRLGIDSLKTVTADVLSAPFKTTEGFDLVLIDPPCSGLGTLRRNPEIKWRIEKRDIDILINIQQELLKSAAAYVKKGGALVYCTCTVNPAEGIEIVDDFVANHPNFSLEDVSPYLKVGTEKLVSGGSLFTPPYVFKDDVTHASDESCGPDGFFAARMKRDG
jgi:16S rRNA (cytosine967-C5)-methyltransferase